MDLTVDMDLTVEAENAVTSQCEVEKKDQSECKVVTSHYIGEQVTAIEGTGSACRLWEGVVVEIDRCSEVYIICCHKVPHYPHGYNMAVPFSDAAHRINQPIHTSKRKRKRKTITDM